MHTKAIIFTTEKVPLMPDFTVTDKLGGVLLDAYDYIIFHSVRETLADTVTTLKRIFSQKQYNLIYITAELDPILYCLFKTYDADIYTDISFLKDEAVLSFFVDDYGKTGMELRGADKELGILENAIKDIESANDAVAINDLLSNKYWMLNLRNALSQLKDVVVRETKVHSGVTDGLTGVLEGLVDSYNSLSSEKIAIEMEKNQLVLDNKNLRDNLASQNVRDNRSNSPFIYPTFNIPLQVEKVLYIKAYSPCRYLNSFVMNYKNYLESAKQTSSAILFIIPHLKLMTTKYNNFATRLVHETMDIVDVKGDSVFYTFEPTSKILSTFFDKKVDLHIVVDLMYGDELVKGYMVNTYTAIASGSDISRFNLQPNRCIIPILSGDGLINIPHIHSYITKTITARQALYFEKCKSSYEQLDNTLFTKKKR